MIFDIFFHASFPVSSTMVTGTPCHSSSTYARRLLVYSHKFVTINRLITVVLEIPKNKTVYNFTLFMVRNQTIYYALLNV